MARTDAGNVLTGEHRRAQLAVRADALRDFIRLWPLWRGDDQTFQSLVAATLPLIRAHHGVSSSLGLAYFEAFRRAERVAGSARPVIAPAVDVEKVVTSLVVTGRIQTRKAIGAGQSPQAAMQTALVRVGGSVTRQVLKGGRDALVLSSGEDPRAQGWTRITDGNACDFCTGLAGQVFRGESAAEFEAHDHCVPAGTLVAGPSVERGFRRWYEGELVIVCLAGGEELAITPNHPVLTERGWVEAGLLREGENVLHRFGADLDALEVPHEDDVPTPIEDVWGAPGMDWLRSVPVAAEDFHGDGNGTQGEVDVVAPHRLLADVLDATAFEFGADPVSAGAGSTSVRHHFSGGGDAALVLLGVGATASGGVSCCDDCLTALGRQRRSMQASGVGDVPPLYSGLSKPSCDDAARDAEALGKRLFGFATGVGGDSSGWRFDAPVPRAVRAGPRFDPPALESRAHLFRAQAGLGRRLLERLAGGVETRRVIELRRIGSWSGHVFNLRTVEGWYAANGVIVSNCGCGAEPSF